jgi:hypothetical protein
VIGGVLVDPATFKQMVVLDVKPREDFETKQHKSTKEGVPLWRVQVAATDWRGRTDTLMVTLASDEDPAKIVGPLSPVVFDELELGVMEREGRTTVWFTAKALRPVAGAKS